MKRVVEDFVCLKCGNKVKGNGYTDHCNNCLWGKHVDNLIPGDRESMCKSPLEPKKVTYVKGKYRIEYKCTSCSHKFVVDAALGDNKEEMFRLI